MEFRTQSNLQLKVFIILWHHTNDLHEYEFYYKKYVFKDEKTSRASFWTQNCVSTFHHLLGTSYVNSPSPFLSLLIIFVYWLTWFRISICKNFNSPSHGFFSNLWRLWLGKYLAPSDRECLKRFIWSLKKENFFFFFFF